MLKLIRKPESIEIARRKSKYYSKRTWKQCILSFTSSIRRIKTSFKEFSRTVTLLIRTRESCTAYNFTKRLKNGCSDQQGARWKTQPPRTRHTSKVTTTTTYGTTLISQTCKISTRRECLLLPSVTLTMIRALPKPTHLKRLELLGFVFTLREDLARRV
jgi:hypothetical protein